MEKALLYIHGKGGSFAEAEQFRHNCPGYALIGVDYQVDYPWLVQEPLQAAYEQAAAKYASLSLIANSIGAFFAMHFLAERRLEQALFISPILDMEQLIRTMMGWAGVSEATLRQRREIPTDFGETLSWEYLQYVRSHPIRWQIPTHILYAGGDQLTSRDTVQAFAQSHQARLTIMEDGEHWFHTDQQIAFLDQWMRAALS